MFKSRKILILIYKQTVLRSIHFIWISIKNALFVQVFTEDLFRNIAGSATDRIITLLNSGISLDVVDSDKTKYDTIISVFHRIG